MAGGAVESVIGTWNLLQPAVMSRRDEREAALRRLHRRTMTTPRDSLSDTCVNTHSQAATAVKPATAAAWTVFMGHM